MPLLEEKEITITTQAGAEKKYMISKFPAVQGREIIAKYPLSALPKLGDYAVNEETMLKLMGFVAVVQDSGNLTLNSRALVDNHVPDWETLARLELAMMDYNCSFFSNGRSLTFFENIAQKGKVLFTKMLTDLLAQSSKREKPASTN